MSVSEQNTFGELWSAKAKEKMRNYLYLDEIRDFVKEWLQQYLHDFPDQFPRNRPRYRIENEFILKLLEDLDK